MRPYTILHCAPFLSTPFEERALNTILLSTSFLSKHHFSAVLSIFFVKVTESWCSGVLLKILVDNERKPRKRRAEWCRGHKQRPLHETWKV